jgi:predicted RNA-binding Zn ribbon-like protein
MREAESHRLVGGDPSLDFANTLNGHRRRPRHEYLNDFRDLALWARHARILTPHEARIQLRAAVARPAAARAAYIEALTLRELLFRMFLAAVDGERPRAADMRQLNARWQEAQRGARLVPSSAGFTISMNGEDVLKRIQGAICMAAVGLLTSGEVNRIRACAGEGCDWLFVDRSRNHMRRWCSMGECGNRAKMRRRQIRTKLSAKGPT